MATQAIPQAKAQSGLGISGIGDWRIRTKLLVIFLIFGLVPTSVLGLISFNAFRDSITEQATNALLAHSVSTAASIDQYLADKREDIFTISQLPEVIRFAINPDDSLAQVNARQALNAMASRTDYESVAIVDPTGKIILSSAVADLNTDVGFRLYFTEAMKGNVYISDPSVSIITNRPAIFFSAPIRDSSNKVIGVVRSRLSLKGIWALVERDKDVEGKGSYGMLLDENGIRIANSLSLGRRDEMEGSQLLYTAVAPLPAQIESMLISEQRFGQAAAAGIRVVPLPEVAAALASPGVKTFETTSDVNAERNLAAIASLSVKPWRYVILSPFSAFFRVLDSLSVIFAVGFGLLLLVIVITAVYVARGFTNPIVQLTQVAERISLGELDAKIDIHRKDEIGELAEAVSRMQASLQAAIERLRARRAAG
jgi:C4-dicarboxylate-specific signal transduction histidine kinase